MGTALAAAEVKEVMLFARGAAAFAAAAAAMDRRCATISVGDQPFSLLLSCCFSFTRACTNGRSHQHDIWVIPSHGESSVHMSHKRLHILYMQAGHDESYTEIKAGM